MDRWHIVVTPRSALAAIRREAPAVLRDVFRYAFASFAITTLFRALLFTQLIWREISKWGGKADPVWVTVFADVNPRIIDIVYAKAYSYFFLAPLSETFIFVLSWKICTRIRTGERIYIILTGAIFGALHVLVKGMNLFMFFSTFIGGTFLAGIFAKERVRYGFPVAYMACAACHALDNFLLFGSVVVAVNINTII